VANSIGTCSGVTLRNVENMPEFDTNLRYAHDCDFYYRFWKQYGDPKILKEITISNFLWLNSITSTITQEFINKENKYILEKYGAKYGNN
jgi:hypothetical protein